jgi:hypothetical protein
VRDLVSAYGKLRAFNLLKDENGVSKGAAFFEYQEAAVIDRALKVQHFYILWLGGRGIRTRCSPGATRHWLVHMAVKPLVLWSY